MAKLQNFRLVEEQAPVVSRTRLFLDAIRGIWQGPISISSPDIARLWGSTPSPTGVQVDHHTALNYSGVWAAVNLIASQIGNLPCVLYQKNPDGGKVRMDWHPTYRLLHDRPNADMSAFIFRETLQAHVLTWGSGYAEITRNGAGRPVALGPITPDRVTPFRKSSDTPLQYRIVQPGGGETFIDDANMLHIPGLSYNGIQGYSVIGHARDSIGLGLATEKFGGAFFGNGATFGGVLSATGPRPDEATIKGMREAINSRHQGVDRAHKMLLLWNDTKYTPLGIPPNDAQFLETRRFQIDEIARWFNIPTHKLKELQSGTNRSTTEQQNLEYYTDCLAPWLQRWEQELCEKLIAPSERNLQDIEFIADGLLRTDTLNRGDFHQKRFSTASATPNELRKLENVNPIPGGEDAFVAFNLAPLAMARPYWQAAIDEKLAQVDLLKAQATKTLEPTPAPLQPTVDQQAREIVTLTEERGTARRVAHEAEDARDLAVAKAAEAVVALVTEQAARTIAEAEVTRLTGPLAESRAHVDRLTAKVAELTFMVEVQTQDYLTKLGDLRAEVATERERVAATEKERARLHALSETGVQMLTEASEREQALIVRAESVEAVIVELRARISILDLSETRAVSLQTRLDDVLMLCASHISALDREKAQNAVYRARFHQIPVAMREVLRHAVQCLVARESDRARKAQRSPEKLAQWATDFYPLHEDFCRDALAAPLHAWAVSTATEGSEAARLEAAVPQYLDDGRRQIQAVAAEADPETLAPSLEKLLRKWDTTRVDAFVAALTQEAV